MSGKQVVLVITWRAGGTLKIDDVPGWDHWTSVENLR
jgi:hypothetical protein